MPVFALKASRTFWKFSCSAPPHRDVTVIVPPAVAEPSGPVLGAVPVDEPDVAAGPLAGGTAGVAPPLHAEISMTAAIGKARKRGNLAIGLLLLLADEPAGPAGSPRLLGGERQTVLTHVGCLPGRAGVPEVDDVRCRTGTVLSPVRRPVPCGRETSRPSI